MILVLQPEAVVPDVIKDVNLTGWLQACQEFVFQLTDQISGFSLEAKRGRESGNGTLCPLGGGITK